MKLQLLSDLHLESESFDPVPAPGAALLVLAGDIDSRWDGYRAFAGWPVPVLVVAGNHEYDGRDIDLALPALRAHCAALGLTLLERQSLVVEAPDGRRIRFVGTTRWSDFDAFGAAARPRAERAGAHALRRMDARREALVCRDWLAHALAEPPAGRWDATVAVTHFAPSLRSADPRYGHQPGTASFCNADDDLIPRADLWLHGHLHCRHDYAVARAGRAPTRVVCHARGLAHKREPDAGPGQAAHDPTATVAV